MTVYIDTAPMGPFAWHILNIPDNPHHAYARAAIKRRYRRAVLAGECDGETLPVDLERWARGRIRLFATTLRRLESACKRLGELICSGGTNPRAWPSEKNAARRAAERERETVAARLAALASVWHARVEWPGLLPYFAVSHDGHVEQMTGVRDLVARLDPKHVRLDGRKWWRKGPGHHIASCAAYVNGRHVLTVSVNGTEPDRQAWRALCEAGWIPCRGQWMSREAGDASIELDAGVETVSRKRDLHSEGA
jgi:hypothetical protein